jgi:hypothetical protein
MEIDSRGNLSTFAVDAGDRLSQKDSDKAHAHKDCGMKAAGEWPDVGRISINEFSYSSSNSDYKELVDIKPPNHM